MAVKRSSTDSNFEGPRSTVTVNQCTRKLSQSYRTVAQSSITSKTYGKTVNLASIKNSKHPRSQHFQQESVCAVCTYTPPPVDIDCSPEKRSNAQTYISFRELPHLTFNVVRKFLSTESRETNFSCGFWLVVDTISPTCPRASCGLQNGTKKVWEVKWTQSLERYASKSTRRKFLITPPIRRNPRNRAG